MADELIEIFFEDMDEQLSIMENTLLDMEQVNVEDVDSEMINKLFRAMHTMKGNSGMFGFDHIVSFAHVAENLLDEIRNGNIKLTQEMIDLFLLVNDHSKTLIEIETQGAQMDDDQLEYNNSLIKQLNGFLNNESVETTELIESENTNDDLPGTTKYQIEINLKDEFFKSGMDLVSIIKYLDVIGEIISIKLIDDKVPPIDKLEPQQAYMSFFIEYETDEPKSEVIDAFEFVQEDIELKIDEQSDQSVTADIKNDITQIKKTDFEDKKETKIINEEPKAQQKQSVELNKEQPDNINKQKSFTLKVDSLKVDKLINQISEMVIANAKITQYALDTDDSDFEEAVIVMSEMLEDIRNGIMNIRMVQVGDSFSKLRRIVNDIAKKTGKEIEFVIQGGETELDKTVVEKISDPLVHMLRNSVDHGIEMPQDRIQKGKSPKGSIVLKAYPDAGSIVIDIIDDGAGINKDIIFNKAVEKNIIDPNIHLSDNDIYNLIFAPGFSTAESISDISGRGVGMDVVKRNIEDLRGTVAVDSNLGYGTKITIRLPLTLAIIDGFLVQVGTTKYIIPLDMIQECIELTAKEKNKMHGNDYITLRSNLLPILDIADHFNDEKVKTSRENIVVVKYGNSTIGLKVDELYGEFQTVIKPLGELFENVAGISGGTILGNGDIALIFDIPKLIEYKIIHKERLEDGN